MLSEVRLHCRRRNATQHNFLSWTHAHVPPVSQTQCTSRVDLLGCMHTKVSWNRLKVDSKAMNFIEFNCIYNYLSRNDYPVGISKDEKRKMRSKARSYFVEDAQLKYGKQRRLVVQDSEKNRILEAYHCNINGGGHFGRNKTFLKLSERYFWKAMKTDVADSVAHCDVCQRVNPKLHCGVHRN